MTLIKSSLTTYVINVPEPDIRAALIIEAADKHGLLHDGKPIPGVDAKVTYDGRRGAGQYTIKLIRDPAKIGQALLGAGA